MKPKATIERVEGMCTASGIGYEVIAPSGYHLGYVGEHSVLVDTKREAVQIAKGLHRCECGGCMEEYWRDVKATA